MMVGYMLIVVIHDVHFVFGGRRDGVAVAAVCSGRSRARAWPRWLPGGGGARDVGAWKGGLDLASENKMPIRERGR